MTPATLTLPNTRLKLSLTGGGAGELLNDPARPGQVKLVVTGTTGESPTLSDDERCELWAAAVDEVDPEAATVLGQRL